MLITTENLHNDAPLVLNITNS